MKQQKERKHKVKQANTLETSRKTLQRAVMGAIHNGGFLFSRNESGQIVPAVVNARLSDIIVAVVSFAISRASTSKELSDLKDYILKVVDHVCSLREKDIEAMNSKSGNILAELSSIISEAEENANAQESPHV